MAITIQAPTAPTGWMPAGNALNYTIQSDQTTQPNFYYLIDVQINDVSRIKLRRFPVNGAAVIADVREIVEAYITTTFELSNTLGFSNDVLKCVVSATEYYSGQAYDTATTAPIYVWNAAAQFEDEQQPIGYYLQNYELKFRKHFVGVNTFYARPMSCNNAADVDDIEVLPSYLQIKRSALDNAYVLQRDLRRPISIFANVTANDAPFVVFLGCDESGKVIKKFYSTFSSVQSNSNALIYTCVGGRLNGSNFTYAADLDGNTPADMNDCAFIVFYYAEFADVVNQPDKLISRPIVLKMCDCAETFAVLYRSFEGSWGVIQCNRRAVETTTIETTTRENIMPTTWAQDTRLISSVNVHAQGRWALNTDWINKNIGDDVKDMLQSPTLFIMHYYEGKLEYIPVTLLNADYVTKQHNDVNLFNYRFEFAEAFYKNTIKH